MANPTRRTSTAAAAALLTVGLVVTGAGAASASAPAKEERITSAEQLKASIAHATQLEQEAGAVELSSGIGGIGNPVSARAVTS